MSAAERLELPGEQDRTRQWLTLYYRALCGEVCSLVPYDEGSSAWEHADTEATVWLPREAPLDDHAEFSAEEWYQAAMTHRALHHTLGTFELDLDRAEPLFDRIRPADTGSPELPALTRLAGLLGHSVLGVHIFATLEDLRIDAAADRIFPGHAASFRGVRHGALHLRPQPAALVPRAAVVEALVRLSLGGSLVMAASTLEAPIARVAAVAARLRDQAATTESSVEATLRICDVLIGLPTSGAHRAVHELRFAELDTDVEAGDVSVDVGSLPARMDGAEGFAGWYHPVAYRDWPGPRWVGHGASDLSLAELMPQVALASRARASRVDDADERADDAPTADPRPDDDAHRAPSARASDGTLPDSRLSAPLPGGADDESVEVRPLRARSSDEFVYPEWDDVAGRYRPAFTRVRVLSAAPVRSDHSHFRALARYGHLVGGLVRAIERVNPAGRDTVRRTAHGDDLDLDACVDALIDVRTGVQPSERIFSDLRRPRRDVAVAFAIDLSGSTAITLPPDPETPGTLRRVLDLQRDAVSLVAAALDRVGDAYGIYGFSGSGRENVRLTVIKDVDEPRTSTTWHRLGGVTPDHTTRMGPAIRHLTRRLAATEAATKVLMVLSDGRPYDIDYGQQYGEQAILGYAVADTARALDEASMTGIHPYLVTIDPDGEDYMAGACDPRRYHVIADARDLPGALGGLYLSVRTDARKARTGRARAFLD